jgi:hypothetical protein
MNQRLVTSYMAALTLIMLAQHQQHLHMLVCYIFNRLVDCKALVAAGESADLHAVCASHPAQPLTARNGQHILQRSTCTTHNRNASALPNIVNHHLTGCKDNAPQGAFAAAAAFKQAGVASHYPSQVTCKLL